MLKKKVLITGATGLLGKQILVKLVGLGYRIYAVKRARSVIPQLPVAIDWIQIKSNQDNLFQLIPEKVDFVIHAGAMVSYKRSDKQKIFSINSDWTTKLAKDALEAGVEKFIFVSSISALGKNSQDNFINEHTPIGEGEFLTNYGKSKRRAEESLWELSRRGLPIVIFNPAVIIGPARRYQSSAQLFAYVSDGKPFYTRGLINYIDVRDVSETIVESLDHGIVNEQFVLNAGSISYRDFFRRIAEQLNVKAPEIGVPKFMLILGAILENIISKINGKSATLTMETAKMAGSQNIYVSQKAKRTFNIEYRTLDESIEWTVSEMQKSGEL